jgi:peptidoglycan hydrolase-like protein with peptidoglycan-binding domain
VQERLAELGFEPGPVDGEFGSRTAAAIKAFQTSRGLGASGEIDDALVTALRSANQTSKTTAAADAPASADRLDVPVLERGGDGQAANCASSVVVGLKADGDGFLAVRSGPGAEFRKIDELHNGDVVYTYDKKGDWFGIAYDAPTVECASRTTRPVPYGKTGWVHGNWLGDLAG